MAKVYELGIARVNFDNPVNKVPAMIDNADRMSGLGWELKTTYDAVTEVVMFYQREKVQQNSQASPSSSISSGIASKSSAET